MSDKPKMYRCEGGKIFNNNRSVYASYGGNNDKSYRVYDTGEVRKKINNIFNSSNFIYRTKVNIVVDNEILSKKIVGLYNDNLVTIDNEQIPISVIKDIYK